MNLQLAGVWGVHATVVTDWFFFVLRFYVPLKYFSRHHCRWRNTKFRPMLVAQGLWAGRDLYRTTPAVTPDLSFAGLIRRTAPISRLLRHTRGCGGSILARILSGVNHFDLKCLVTFFLILITLYAYIIMIAHIQFVACEQREGMVLQSLLQF